MSEPGVLYVCATPIGNLGDVSDRLRQTLATVDVVYAEDTRRTAKLLNHIGVNVRARSLFAGNEKGRSAELVEDIKAGRNVALVSDAGMPTVSDPGSAVVDDVRRAGGRVTVIPGPSAVTTSIALSGLGGDRFVFEGFLPRRGTDRRVRIATISDDPRPVVLFVAPHRLVADLADLAEAIGEERLVSVSRELTKVHEEVWSGTLGDAVDHWSSRTVKGEFTVVVGPASPQQPSIEVAVDNARGMVEDGMTLSNAARASSEETGISRREIYQALLSDQELS